MVFKLNQRQAAESQVYTAVAAAIEAQLARFAKSDSEPQRAAAQRLADALAVVFQSAINPQEREQAPSPSSSATPPSIAHPSSTPPSTTPSCNDAGPKSFRATAAANLSTRAAGLAQTIDIS